MGKDWDGDPLAFSEDFWRAVLRVLKPGGLIVSFGGTRTYQHIARAIEDAGATPADCLMWLHGQGFPKSKALLKPAWEPIILARKPGPLRELGIDATRISAPGGLTSGGEWHKREGDDWHMGPRRADEHPAGRWPSNVVLSHIQPAPDGHGGCRRVGTRRVRGAGWSDADDAPNSMNRLLDTRPSNKSHTGKHYADPDGTEEVEAWLCAEGCPVDALDRQAGERKGMQRGTLRRGATTGTSIGGHSAYGTAQPQEVVTGYDDTGGASRFFPTFGDDGEATRFRYVAKASRAEREAGLEGLALYGEAQEGGAYAGGVGLPGRTLVDGEWQQTGTWEEPNRNPRRNIHPTCKPLALMRWLCRLVTPPGGTILDPFCGSGSTGCAAVLEGFRFVGVEREEEYITIAKRRIEHWSGASLPLFRRET